MQKITSEQLRQLREDYQAEQLNLSGVPENPMVLFDHWMAEALLAGLPEPNAMTLATCGQDGWPSARVVLLKGVDEKGFQFFTNYESDKGRELEANPKAALTFVWLELQRQVRIRGKVEKLPAHLSTAYFQSRPRASQLGAWASPQSRVIPDRSILDDNLRAMESRFQNENPLPCPPHWGGFLVVPDQIEFWQGRSSRLHDRIKFTCLPDKSWQIQRLAP
ncbi:MAG: pyridoxamine 5'-phosphate oxidase [Saprospiraceae bacterium]|nr:pyridoxamine 5'-phosphate oxidase [Saprospiraceae bacterium]